MTDTKISIELRDWDHTCGDGCCSTYGTDVILNGETIGTIESYDLERGLSLILGKLGIEADIERAYDDDETND